jgi:hypothetical protein
MTCAYNTHKPSFTLGCTEVLHGGIICPQVDGLVWFGFMVFNATFNNISVLLHKALFYCFSIGQKQYT